MSDHNAFIIQFHQIASRLLESFGAFRFGDSRQVFFRCKEEINFLGRRNTGANNVYCSAFQAKELANRGV